MNARRSPFLLHSGLAFGLTLLLTGLAWYGLGRPAGWPIFLGTWLTAVNLTTMSWYGWDKWRASRNGNRVPELVLHSLALAGGSLGAYAGMRLFRHKTLKGSFRAVFALIVLLQIALIVWLAYRWWQGDTGAGQSFT